MTVLATAPQRIALMLKDADSRIRNSWYTERLAVDQAERPAWVVRDGDDSQYEVGGLSAQAAVGWNETYTAELHGPYFGAGVKDEKELELRAIVANTLRYFYAHPRLQFSNLRADPALTPLPMLQGVLYCTFRKEHAGLYVPPGFEESQTAWGVRLHITIFGKSGAREVLV